MSDSITINPGLFHLRRGCYSRYYCCYCYHGCWTRCSSLKTARVAIPTSRVNCFRMTGEAWRLDVKKKMAALPDGRCCRLAFW